MEKNMIKAQIFASMSPGGHRQEIYDVEMDMSTAEQQARFLKVGSSGKVAQYYLLEMDSPAGKVSVALPPDGGLCGLADEALRCHIPARFRAQAWINDWAREIDDGHADFNAVTSLIKMDLARVQAMFAQGSDFDALADGLHAREQHDGPFEVEIDQADVVRAVCLLSGMHGALGENDSVQDIKPAMWDDFCIAARGILAAKGLANPLERADKERVLTIDHNRFIFSGEPGQVCGLEAHWAAPQQDAAERLATGLMVSQMLALYSKGVLWRPDLRAFDPDVVDALQTTFDHIPELIVSSDDAEAVNASSERGLNERGG